MVVGRNSYCSDCTWLDDGDVRRGEGLNALWLVVSVTDGLTEGFTRNASGDMSVLPKLEHYKVKGERYKTKSGEALSCLGLVWILEKHPVCAA